MTKAATLRRVRSRAARCLTDDLWQVIAASAVCLLGLTLVETDVLIRCLVGGATFTFILVKIVVFINRAADRSRPPGDEDDF